MSDSCRLQSSALMSRSQGCPCTAIGALEQAWQDPFVMNRNTYSFSIPQPAIEAEPPLPGNAQPSQSREDFDINTLWGSNPWQLNPNDRRLTFSFVTNATAPLYPVNAIPAGTVVQPVSPIVQGAVRNILNGDGQGLLGLFGLTHFLNMQFEEVPEIVLQDGSVQAGDIRIMYTLINSNSFYARANFPGNQPTAGDVYLNPNNPTNSGGREEFNLGPNSIGYETLMHELGHALGLKHPGNYDGDGNGVPPFLNLPEDNLSNTLMSYHYGGTYPSTYMPYDIRVLQSMYGVNQNFNNQDNNYPIGQLDLSAMKRTIWDTGGIDVFDFSALPANQPGYYLDLRQGGSSKRLQDREERLITRNGTVVNNNGTTYSVDRNGLSIAFGTVIEDVIGSSSNDYIYGNSAENWITPGLGVDMITLGGGRDRVIVQVGEGSNRPDTDSTIDTVTDFVSGTDRIEIRGNLTRDDLQTNNGYLNRIDANGNIVETFLRLSNGVNINLATDVILTA